MRYINLVPPVVKKPVYESEKDKYNRYMEKNVEYRNRPDRKEFMKDYYAEYRKELSGYVNCDCGSVVKEISMYNHVKSNKHINYLTS
jgi:hypothetical protein